MAKFEPRAQDYITSVHMWLAKQPEWSLLYPLSQVGKSVVLKDLPFLGATDGWNKFYQERAVLTLSKEERRGLVIHELMHQAGMHFSMYKDLHDKDKKLANMAMDYEINMRIHDTKDPQVALPKGGLLSSKFRGWTVRRIFRYLQANPPPPNENGQGGEGGPPMDDHDFSAAQGNTPSPPEQARDIAEALEQGRIIAQKIKQVQAGSGSAGMEGALGDLRPSQQNWKEELRDFFTTHCAGSDESTWRKPNRKYIQCGVLRPSGYSLAVDKVVIGFDTSGSCFGTAEMTAFVSEVESIMASTRPREVIVAYVDTEVVGTQVFHDGQFAVQSMAPRGGGGTNLEVLYPWLKQNGHADADALLWLSDGRTGFTHAPPIPVLWCLTENITPPYGRRLRIDV